MSSTALERLGPWIGRDMVSDWRTITQRDIDAYSEITGDKDWLHNDPERAKREAPFGGTIVQGFFLLATIVDLATRAMRPIWDDVGEPAMGLNYGLDRARFVRPTPVDSRIRVRVAIRDIEEKGEGRYRIRNAVVIERDGAVDPPVVAEWLFMVIYPAHG